MDPIFNTGGVKNGRRRPLRHREAKFQVNSVLPGHWISWIPMPWSPPGVDVDLEWANGPGVSSW